MATDPRGTGPDVTAPDFYAGANDTSDGRVFTVTGQDWDQITQGVAGDGEDPPLGGLVRAGVHVLLS